jgi:hypothetical protein
MELSFGRDEYVVKLSQAFSPTGSPGLFRRARWVSDNQDVKREIKERAFVPTERI